MNELLHYPIPDGKMRILICGDRNWSDYAAIYDYIKTLDQDSIVIHGNARGADKIAGYYATIKDFKVEVYPAQWNRYGKAAGPIRNKQMLDEGKPDLVVYFHDDLESSKGTKHMVNLAKQVGIEVKNGKG